jgi:hypothetical protein
MTGESRPAMSVATKVPLLRSARSARRSAGGRKDGAGSEQAYMMKSWEPGAAYGVPSHACILTFLWRGKRSSMRTVNVVLKTAQWPLQAPSQTPTAPSGSSLTVSVATSVGPDFQ